MQGIDAVPLGSPHVSSFNYPADEAILSAEQVARYNTLRGYAENPGASVPEGHDPVMRRRHNNCN